MKIRRPHAGDAAALAVLLQELGTTIPVATLAGRLREGLADANQRLLLAGEDQALGLIQAFRTQRITRGTFIEIGSLVVRQQARRQGIARALVEQIRDWAETEELPLRVRCNTTREQAHRFYETLGFRREKNQAVYTLPHS